VFERRTTICRITCWTIHVLGGEKTGEGGEHQTVQVQSTFDVVVGGKHRQLSMPIVTWLILQRECEDDMSMGHWTERDAWVYREGGKE
jgi:hypothetical protein